MEIYLRNTACKISRCWNKVLFHNSFFNHLRLNYLIKDTNFLSIKIKLFHKTWRARLQSLLSKVWVRFRVGVCFGRVSVVFHQNIVDRARAPYLTLNICSHFEKQVLFIQTGWRDAIWLSFDQIRNIFCIRCWLRYVLYRNLNLIWRLGKPVDGYCVKGICPKWNWKCEEKDFEELVEKEAAAIW